MGTHLKVVGGSGERGAALLRKESSEFEGEGSVDSAVDSAKLPFLVNWGW